MPPAYPVSSPLVPITLWHGTIIDIGLCPTAPPIACADILFIFFSFATSIAMSLYVTCDTAMEMETLYSELKSGGAILMPKTEIPPTFREFAWVQDKYGVNFQLALPENQ